MKNVFTRTMFALAVVALLSVLSGCTDWKKKYEGLEVEHTNLRGRFDRCEELLGTSAVEQQRLNQMLIDHQNTIRELQNMEANGTDFGGGLDWVANAQKGTLTATLSNEILFSAGKATLKKSTIAELDEVMGVLRQQYPTQDVSIVGHTDSDPIKKSGWKDNWELSTERSLAVVRYLVQRGLRPERVKAAGAGEFRPVKSNSTASGKAKNRRVEVVIHLL